jgi:hypothetical protein
MNGGNVRYKVELAPSEIQQAQCDSCGADQHFWLDIDGGASTFAVCSTECANSILLPEYRDSFRVVA